MEPASRPGVDRPLDRLHRDRRVARDLRRELARHPQEVLGRYDLLDEADPLRLLRREAATRQREQFRRAGAAFAGEAEIRTAHHGHADGRLGQREHGVGRRDADVAEERQLDAGAEAVPLDRDDHGLG